MKRKNESDEEFNARKRQEYVTNRGSILERKRKWRDENREQMRAIWRKFADSKHGQQRRKEWRDSHPENVRTATYRYRGKMTPEEQKQVARRHRNNTWPKLKRGLRDAQRSDEKAGRQFDAELYEVVRYNPPTHCACCSVKLDYEVVGRGCRNRSPSPDRVINTIGHTLTNTRYVCGRCNAIKSDGTVEEHEMIVAYMRRHMTTVKP